jgi:hypothetical protein
MAAWILLAVVTAVAGTITIARLVRVRKLSRVTVTDPQRLGEELLEYVARQGRPVVDLRPFWNTRQLAYADRWAVQEPLHLSGRLVAADHDASLIGALRNYVLAPVPEYVALPK